MNKDVPTHDRVFMSIVGPRCCGKTELPTTFQRYATSSNHFSGVPTTFQRYATSYTREWVSKKFKFWYNRDCLLIYVNSCEDISNDKDFVKITTSGRLCKLYTSSVYMFYTSSIICFIKANGPEPFIWMQLTGPDPITLFIFCPLKQFLQQLQMKKKHLLMLKQWANKRNENTAQIKTLHKSDFIWFLSDCVMNLLSGVVSISEIELKKIRQFTVQTCRQASWNKWENQNFLISFWNPSN